MSQINEALATPKNYNFVEIENLIEKGLRYDWAISIEYADRVDQNAIQWLKWNKTLFAIKDSKKVMDELKACCKNNPECSMKLVCEHFNPYCRLIYCIYENKPGPVLRDQQIHK